MAICVVEDASHASRSGETAAPPDPPHAISVTAKTPPNATVRMTVNGFMNREDSGEWRLLSRADLERERDRSKRGRRESGRNVHGHHVLTDDLVAPSAYEHRVATDR